MSGRTKRPRLQTTTASDIASQATRHFTHSSNTSTRTRQVLTSAPLEPTLTPLSLTEDSEMYPLSYDDIPVTVTGEFDHPAGVEIKSKARRYVNSVKTLIQIRHITTKWHWISGHTFAHLEGLSRPLFGCLPHIRRPRTFQPSKPV